MAGLRSLFFSTFRLQILSPLCGRETERGALDIRRLSKFVSNTTIAVDATLGFLLVIPAYTYRCRLPWRRRANDYSPLRAGCAMLGFPLIRPGLHLAQRPDETVG